jgi:hypothetical protein
LDASQRPEQSDETDDAERQPEHQKKYDHLHGGCRLGI